MVVRHAASRHRSVEEDGTSLGRTKRADSHRNEAVRSRTSQSPAAMQPVAELTNFCQSGYHGATAGPPTTEPIVGPAPGTTRFGNNMKAGAHRRPEFKPNPDPASQSATPESRTVPTTKEKKRSTPFARFPRTNKPQGIHRRELFSIQNPTNPII